MFSLLEVVPTHSHTLAHTHSRIRTSVPTRPCRSNTLKIVKIAKRKKNNR